MAKPQKEKIMPRCMHGLLLNQCVYCENNFKLGVAHLMSLISSPTTPEIFSELVKENFAKIKKQEARQ